MYGMIEYVGLCNHCHTEHRVRSMMFFKAQPYCWDCRNQLIAQWAVEAAQYALDE